MDTHTASLDLDLARAAQLWVDGRLGDRRLALAGLRPGVLLTARLAVVGIAAATLFRYNRPRISGQHHISERISS